MPSLEHLAALASPRRARRLWREPVTALLDLLFPPFCPVCQERLGAGRRDPLCGGCWVALPRISPPVCRLCGAPFFLLSAGEDPVTAAPPPAVSAEAEAGHLCGACRLRPPGFSYARAAARYAGAMREAVHAFKFSRRRALAGPLGDLLAEAGAANATGDGVELLVPVPLHPRRQRERGFNQSELLARRLGRHWGVPVGADALVRTAATRPQTDLSAPERRANVRGAFALLRPGAVEGRHVLLIDDVMTTGATVGECARCLRAGGAARVGVLTVARVV